MDILIKKLRLGFFISLLTLSSCVNDSVTNAPLQKDTNFVQQKNLKPQVEQAVIVHFKYGIQGLDSLHALEDKLENEIVTKQIGEYDGHEIATSYSDGFLYMYGPDAEKLFNGIRQTLEQTSFMKGAKVVLRFGPPEDGVKETTIEL